MPLDGFHEWITPADRFFVRCHTYLPAPAHLSDWTLKLDGVVNQPLTLTMDDLKKLPRVEMVAVLECAGNGRSFYQPHVAGTQWDFGSVGNGRWAGVRFRDVLAKAGLKDSAKEILLDGADTPLGTMPKFQRTITVKKALDPDTLLVYEMNGAPLPAEHGFPLRLMAPGWASDSWVKWLRHVEVLDHEFDGFWMKTAYRHPPNHVEPGASVDPAAMVPVSDLNVKSVIATPSAWTKPGTVRISGTAWSNSSPLTRVDVSVDGGQTWKQAQARQGSQPVRLAPLGIGLESATRQTHPHRARHQRRRPERNRSNEEWNPSGYLWNVAQKMDVEVANRTHSKTRAADRDPPAAFRLSSGLPHLSRRKNDAPAASHARPVGSRSEQNGRLGREDQTREPRSDPQIPVRQFQAIVTAANLSRFPRGDTTTLNRVACTDASLPTMKILGEPSGISAAIHPGNEAQAANRG